jgi:hypothetical protein
VIRRRSIPPHSPLSATRKEKEETLGRKRENKALAGSVHISLIDSSRFREKGRAL